MFFLLIKKTFPMKFQNDDVNLLKRQGFDSGVDFVITDIDGEVVFEKPKNNEKLPHFLMRQAS